MKTAEQASESVVYQPCLLENIKPSYGELRFATIGSLLFHAGVLLVLLAMPREFSPRAVEEKRQRVTPLFDPPTRLTQTAPNRAPLSQEISVASDAAATPERKEARGRRRFQAPPPSLMATKPRDVLKIPQDAPKILAQSQPSLRLEPQMTLPQPPLRTDEPKLQLEAPPPPPQPGQGTGRLKVPTGGINEIVQDLAHGAQGSQSVGDNTEEVPREHPFGANPGALRPKTNVELVSDPKGVDFKPYLIQVLSTVRRNWFAVMPESVHLGQQRGRVVLQFSIARDGSITKVIFTTESGSATLDRAAVAAISMSNRLPPLPAGYKDERVVLQFTFLYNAPR